MTLSARNRLAGKVTEIEFGGVVAHVVMRGGDNVIESVITKRSAEEMAAAGQNKQQAPSRTPLRVAQGTVAVASTGARTSLLTQRKFYTTLQRMKEGARSVRMLGKLEVVKLRKSWSHNE